jgi:predicted nucleotidyltransferase
MSNTSSDTTTQERIALAQQIANAYATLPHVEAVALAGSQTLGIADPGSDLDLYVYVQGALSLAERHAVATQFADRLELDNQFWEPGEPRTSCSRIPLGMAEQIQALLQAGAVGDPIVIEALDSMIDALDDLLRQAGVL